MSVVATPGTSHVMASPPQVVAGFDAPPDRVWRQLWHNRRVRLGGGGLFLMVFLCVASLPWTREHRGDASNGGIQYNRQHAEFVRTPPAWASRPDDVTPADWQSLQSKLSAYQSTQGLGAVWRWFGTDGQARSMLGRCLYGGVISLSIGFAAATLSVLLGVSVGLISGYRGGWVDATLMRLVDVLYGLPYILLVILFRIAFQDPLARLMGDASDANMVVLFLAIGLVSWLTMARVVRGQVLSLRGQPFVEAARAAGLPESRIFLRHLLPNLVGPIIVYTTLTIPAAILQESFLSFLGVGIQPPKPTWGSLASEGLAPALNTIHSDWWLLVFPCALLAAVLLCLNFLGDGLRDVFDPRKETAKI